MEKVIENKDIMNLSLVINIYIPRGHQHDKKCKCVTCTESARKIQEIINDITLERYVAAKAYSTLYFSQMLGAEMAIKDGDIRINPGYHDKLDESGRPIMINKEEIKTTKDGKETIKKNIKPLKEQNAQSILEMVFGKTGKAPNYAMRDWINSQFPRWRSDIADLIRKEITTIWQAKDPEFTNASRGWLTMQAQRNVAKLQNIPLFIRTYSIKCSDHTIGLSWKFDDSDDKKPIYFDFKINAMDRGRWQTWKNILSGKYKMGDPVKLALKWGKHGPEFRLIIGYSRPAALVNNLDRDRTMELSFTQDANKFINMRMLQGHVNHIDEMRQEALNTQAAIMFIDQKHAQRERLENAKKGCGNRAERTTGEGVQIAFDALSKRINGVAEKRINGVKTWNHRWSSHIVNKAIEWKCGEIRVFDLPKRTKNEPLSGGILGRPWEWADFISKLTYKCKDVGVKLTIIEGNKKTEDL